MLSDTIMHLTWIFSFCLLSFGIVLALPSPAAPEWPNLPLKTNGNKIVDASNNAVTFAGVNWPGAGEVMIPEGLQYSSIADIVSKIKGLGMNVVRLTFAIEMVDDILDQGGDVTLQDALHRSLGETNGSNVLSEILSKNPSFSTTTKRLEVFDAVAAELSKQQIYVHLDNHISKAGWCCNPLDGNSWFGDKYFDVDKWKRGLSFMADHAKAWKAYTSIGLRNELRPPVSNPLLLVTYGWPKWYLEMPSAAQAVHKANPDSLIFFPGIDSDTNLKPITAGSDFFLGLSFDLNSYSYKDKIVFELHDYDNNANNCTALQSTLYNNGFNAMDTSSSTTAKNIAPVVLTEFGFEQTPRESQRVYAQCLKDFVTKNKYGWMQWTISGSYYIRSGIQDYEETWGLLNHDWSTWRSQEVIDSYTRPMIDGTLS